MYVFISTNTDEHKYNMNIRENIKIHLHREMLR